MADKLRISFDDPEHGWVCLSISCGDRIVRIVGSYTPSDSFRELTIALLNLLTYEGQFIVTWHEEPAETDLRFTRSGDTVGLQMDQYPYRHRGIGTGERVLEVSGTYDEICLPFWRALRSLQGRFTIDELNVRWHRPFPWDEIAKLTAEIKKAQSRNSE